MEEKTKKRMIQCHGYSDEDKSLKRWGEIRSKRKVLKNRECDVVEKSKAVHDLLRDCIAEED